METRRQIIPIQYIFVSGSRERAEGGKYLICLILKNVLPSTPIDAPLNLNPLFSCYPGSIGP